MATLSEYFETEAREFLAQLDTSVANQGTPDAAELHRAVRGLRGTAQMAREDRVLRAVVPFEAVTRALATNALSWSDDIAARTREAVADLRALVERNEDENGLEARVDASIDRWRESGVSVPGAMGSTPPSAGSESSEFRDFAAREVAGIADALDKGVQAMAAAPMDREPLKMILRRQRALLGAARLDEIPVVAEILRAIEDLTRVIAKLDVGVKQEWLDIYRVAREGLKGTIEPLQRDEDPQPSHALSRLRHMREELLERYGVGEAVSAAHQSEGLVQAARMREPPAPVQLPVEDENSATATQLADAIQHQDEMSGEDGGELELLEADELVLEADELVLEADELVLEDEHVIGSHHDDTHDEDAPDLVGAAARLMQRVGGVAAGAVSGAAAAISNSEAPSYSSDAQSDADTVSIDDLCYDRTGALGRASELRAAIENALTDSKARDAVEELFDLIRIAQR